MQVVNRLGCKAHTGRFRTLSLTIRSLYFRLRDCDQFPYRTYNTFFRFSVLSLLCSSLSDDEVSALCSSASRQN